MSEIERLEMLSESIKNEIDELQSLLEHSDEFMLKAKRNKYELMLKNIISNLESANNGVYGVFEELNVNDNSEELEEENAILKELLKEKLDHDDLNYIRIKHNIELF